MEDPLLPLWRKVIGVLLYVCGALGALLTLTMLVAGFRWLYLELSGGFPLSLSLALLGGATAVGVTSLILIKLGSLSFRSRSVTNT